MKTATKAAPVKAAPVRLSAREVKSFLRSHLGLVTNRDEELEMHKHVHLNSVVRPVYMVNNGAVALKRLKKSLPDFHTRIEKHGPFKFIMFNFKIPRKGTLTLMVNANDREETANVFLTPTTDREILNMQNRIDFCETILLDAAF